MLKNMICSFEIKIRYSRKKIKKLEIERKKKRNNIGNQ